MAEFQNYESIAQDFEKVIAELATDPGLDFARLECEKLSKAFQAYHEQLVKHPQEKNSKLSEELQNALLQNANLRKEIEVMRMEFEKLQQKVQHLQQEIMMMNEKMEESEKISQEMEVKFTVKFKIMQEQRNALENELVRVMEELSRVRQALNEKENK